MLADVDPGFKFLSRCKCTRDQAQRFGLIQETYRPLPLLFIRNRQAGTNDNLAEAIAIVRFTDGSFRFHGQVRVFEFRAPRDGVERGRKATRERGHQQVFGRPPAVETAELRRRREMDCVRGRIGFGDACLAGRPPSYNVVLMFIFHSVLRVLPAFSKKAWLLLRQPILRSGTSSLAQALVLDDSLPATLIKRWPRSRLFVMPITPRVLQYAHFEGAECAPLTA